MARTAQPQAIRADIYAEVTAAIIKQLEAGTRPWAKSWKTEGGFSPVRPLRHNFQPYSGINVLMLWGVAQEKGYSNPVWMTFQQAQELGGHVRKGEKSARVVYAGAVSKEVEGSNGETEEQRIPFLKSYCVFNAEQIDGLPAQYAQPKAVEPTGAQPIEHAEAFFAQVGADVRHGGDKAFYNHAGDFIQLPKLSAFKDGESYIATRAHETVHWSGAKHRLDREFGKRFGDERYACEELVAEIGAAFLAADLGLYAEPREDHASYVANWLKVLKQDKRAIFTAASAAQKACDFIHGQAGQEVRLAA